MRFHVLAVPHAVTVPEYSTCAFTQKVLKLCKMLTANGHHVIHYGHEKSVVDCTEHVTVTTDADLVASYGDHDWKTKGWPPFAKTDPIYNTFYANAISAVRSRCEPGDFLLCSFGDWHRPVADIFPEMLIVESGIGYPDGTFAKFRVFESYAAMHAHQGIQKIKTSSNDFWHDVVIPNAFDISDFEFSNQKKDYFLFLGRVTSAKGVHVAAQISQTAGIPLIVAGPGDFDLSQYGSQIKKVGVAGPDMRKLLLRDARALIAPSTFMEPFCGTQVEAMLSGTPVISTDWGAFAEYNLHGRTGYRCKTFEHFEWAARNIDKISPLACRAWAERFSLENVAPMYDEYFQSVANSRVGAGWYTKSPHRTDLNNVTFRFRD
jgi:glycosyltransferase involved in cell wall biosynthesis